MDWDMLLVNLCLLLNTTWHLSGYGAFMQWGALESGEDWGAEDKHFIERLPCRAGEDCTGSILGSTLKQSSL